MAIVNLNSAKISTSLEYTTMSDEAALELMKIEAIPNSCLSTISTTDAPLFQNDQFLAIAVLRQ